MFGRSLFITVLVITCVVVTEGAALCDEIYNQTPDGKLGYVKKNSSEWSNRDLINENGKLKVFCEVENFCLLEWYDNITGEHIQEEEGYISFERDNQVLILEQARLSDGRYYKCQASQGNEELEPRVILVQVLEENTGGLALLTHPKCKNQTDSELGDDIEIYCEYSVGTYQPWFLSTHWEKENDTDNEFLDVRFWDLEYKNDPEVNTVYDERNNNQMTDGVFRKGLWIYSTTLYLWNTSQEAFVNYKLVYDNGAGAQKEHILALALKPKQPVDKTVGLFIVAVAIGIVLISSLLLGVVYYWKRLDIKLYWKDHFSRDCKNDKKENDVYISYSHSGESEEDLNFVFNVLRVHLESRGYRVFIRDKDILPGTVLAEEIVKSLDTSHRCILVISPTYVNSSVGNFDINVMMDQVQNYKKQIVPIIYRDISNTSETNNKKLLKHIMENVKCLTWPEMWSEGVPDGDSKIKSKKLEKKKETFCKELMLRMPPLHLRKQSPVLDTTISRVELVGYEERQISVTSNSSFHNGFSSIYPHPDPNFSSKSVNVATVSGPVSGRGGEPASIGPAKLYPVLEY